MGGGVAAAAVAVATFVNEPASDFSQQFSLPQWPVAADAAAAVADGDDSRRGLLSLLPTRQRVALLPTRVRMLVLVLVLVIGGGMVMVGCGWMKDALMRWRC